VPKSGPYCPREALEKFARVAENTVHGEALHSISPPRKTLDARGSYKGIPAPNICLSARLCVYKIPSRRLSLFSIPFFRLKLARNHVGLRECKMKRVKQSANILVYQLLLKREIEAWSHKKLIENVKTCFKRHRNTSNSPHIPTH